MERNKRKRVNINIETLGMVVILLCLSIFGAIFKFGNNSGLTTAAASD